MIRVYDAAGNVIETHEHSSRSMYSDCQFVSERVNCCVRSCYRYGTRFGHLYYEIKLNSKNLCRWIKPIDVSGMLAAKADVGALKNLTLITEDLARYENTRDPNCKRIKDCKALRAVRTGADAGLARWETREAQIASFAKKNGWRLRHYSHGFCAIFDKEPSS